MMKQEKGCEEDRNDKEGLVRQVIQRRSFQGNTTVDTYIPYIRVNQIAGTERYTIRRVQHRR